MFDSHVRAAVTGLGAITPVGIGVQATWAGFLAGTSGISTIEDEWAEILPVRIAGQIKADITKLISVREYKRTDRVAQLSLIAAREAWEDAGKPGVEPERLAVVIGTGIGGMNTTLTQSRNLDASGPRRVSPHAVTQLMANGPAAWVSIEIGARGGTRTCVSACASGAEAVAMGLEMIRAGSVDVVLVGGVDATINDVTISAFAQMRALSTRNEEPELASRPFDRDRSGFVLGEGAAILVLEREDFARSRGAYVYGAIAGAGITSDARDLVVADARSQQRAIELALASGSLTAQDIGFVHAHATSTPVGDPLEAGAIAAAIGEGVPVTSTKSMTGHLLGGAGALGAIAAVLALHEGQIPCTVNVDHVDDGIALDVITQSPRPTSATAAISNASGFGGHNVALAFVSAEG